jgi:hypothetical protein
MTLRSCICLQLLLFRFATGGLWNFGRPRGIYAQDKDAIVVLPGFADSLIHPERITEFTRGSDPVSDWIRKYLAIGPAFLKPESPMKKIRPFYVCIYHFTNIKTFDVFNILGYRLWKHIIAEKHVMLVSGNISFFPMTLARLNIIFLYADCDNCEEEF